MLCPGLETHFTAENRTRKFMRFFYTCHFLTIASIRSVWC